MLPNASQWTLTQRSTGMGRTVKMPPLGNGWPRIIEASGRNPTAVRPQEQRNEFSAAALSL